MALSYLPHRAVVSAEVWMCHSTPVCGPKGHAKEPHTPYNFDVVHGSMRLEHIMSDYGGMRIDIGHSSSST